MSIAPGHFLPGVQGLGFCIHGVPGEFRKEVMPYDPHAKTRHGSRNVLGGCVRVAIPSAEPGFVQHFQILERRGSMIF